MPFRLGCRKTPKGYEQKSAYDADLQGVRRRGRQRQCAATTDFFLFAPQSRPSSVPIPRQITVFHIKSHLGALAAGLAPPLGRKVLNITLAEPLTSE